MTPSPTSAVRLDLPDLPGPRVRRVQRVPVSADRPTLRQHARTHRVDERVPVDRHEIVLVEENPLDRLDQSLALLLVEARLVLGPQGLDLRLADEGCRASAHGVDGDIRLLDVVFRHGRLRALQRVAILRADPVAPWLADPLRFLLDEE